MMHHQLDEFSVTDIRHTLSEVWRVIVGRRWFFIFPFCIVSTIALVCSLWVPRQYASTTVVRREHDPVFASMVGASWTHPYKEIRQRMESELQDEKVITEVLDKLNLPEDLERFSNGELTPESLAARKALVRQVSAGVSVTSLESSASRDVVSIRLTLPEASIIPGILTGIRDRCISSARRKTVQMLHDVETFFLAESERCRGELSSLQKKMFEYGLQYPEIDPDSADRIRVEQTSLTVEKVDLERQIEHMMSKRRKLEVTLARVVSGEGPLPTDALHTPAFSPNPRYVALSRQIDVLLKEIADGKTLRFMTEQHPVIRRIRERLVQLQEELASTPPEDVLEAGPLGPGEAELAAREAERQLRAQIADIDADVAAVTGRMGEVHDRIESLENRRAQAIEFRPDYLKIKQKAGEIEAEMVSWAKNIGPIRHVLTVENRNRTVHFATVQDVAPIMRPTAPSARGILTMCLGIGAAFGGLCVLLLELLDRSYRTVKQLRTSLGIPVIEGIDQIATRAARRKRVVREMVLMPTAALLLFGLMCAAGAAAYLSIERPGGFDQLKSSTGRVYSQLAGLG